MRYFILLSALLLNACSSEAPETLSTTIQGTIDSLSEADNWVYLEHFDPISQRRTLVDSASIETDGSFKLIREIEEPDLFQLRFPGKQSATVVFEPTDESVEIKAEGKRGGSFSIAGSPASELLQRYDEFRKESNERLIKPAYAAMREASNVEDEQGEIEAVEAYVEASKIHRQELLQFTKEHIGASPALFGTVLRWTGDEEISLLDDLVNGFSEKYPDLRMTKVMQDKVNRYRKVAIGATIPELIQNSSEGGQIDIRDHLGAYTLIDFWASWCSPCILQIPDIKQAINTYGDQGFRVFGVSFDSKEDKWKAAIEKYALDWPHVSDVKGWQSQQAKDFNVTFVPFNLLVDADGKIVAKNLHSKTLEATLDRLLSES